MKYVDEFRDGAIARALAGVIAREAVPGRRYRVMEFCGGHTHAISRFGIVDLLPPAVRLVHGPGCPVCVLPAGRIDDAIALALEHRAIVCTYGDVMRVPASHGRSLFTARARGADVRMIRSPTDALAIAADCPDREVVFLAIGFETTTPPTAAAIVAAARIGLANFSVLCCHVLTPPAIARILGDGAAARASATTPEAAPATAPATAQANAPSTAVDAVIGPGHVATVIGSAAFARFAREQRTPVVVAGFEPLDVMQAVLMIVRQLNAGRAEVENAFTRAVTDAGNAKAQALVDEVFERRESFEWRGLGEVADSALRIRARYRRFDADARFGVASARVADHPACACGEILRGAREPRECRLFGTGCTPEHPVGACMVSSEGACAAHYAFGRWRDDAPARQHVAGTDAAPPATAAPDRMAGGSRGPS